MQISRCVYTEVPTQGALCRVATGPGAGVPGFGTTEGMRSPGRASDARPRAYAVERATEILGVGGDGIHQGQERDSHRPGVCWSAKEFRWAAFLGARLLGIDGGQERGCCAAVYPGAGKGRQTPRTTGDGGALSASR